jgi:hypothetical protein
MPFSQVWALLVGCCWVGMAVGSMRGVGVILIGGVERRIGRRMDIGITRGAGGGMAGMKRVLRSRRGLLYGRLMTVGN